MEFYILAAMFLVGVVLLGISLFIMEKESDEGVLPEKAEDKAADIVLREPSQAESRLFSKFLEPGTSTEMSITRKNLMQAGWDSASAPRQFSILKLGFALFGGILGVILIASVEMLQQQVFIIRLNLVVILFICFYLIPSLIVQILRKRFRDKISRALPDALDLMLVSVESGQSIDNAILRVARDMSDLHPELARRFDAVSEALKAGADRSDTFFKLAYETDNEDLRSFAAVVMQSISSGAPIAETFRVYSADLRDQRVRRIEEKANKLPTKMTLGTMLFTVPPLIMLLLAPAVARILSAI